MSKSLNKGFLRTILSSKRSVKGFLLQSTAVLFTTTLLACSLDEDPFEPILIGGGGSVLAGSLDITVVTNGTPADADGYTIGAMGHSQSISTSGTVSFPVQFTTTSTAMLEGLAENCAVEGLNPREVDVVVGQTTTLTFVVNCFANPIVYQRDLGSGIVDIWLVEEDGDLEVDLTDGDSWNSEPVWSPMGDKILFASDRFGQLELLFMVPNGTGITRLTPGGSNVESGFGWSPDGTKVVFSQDGEISVVQVDSRSVSALTTHDSADVRPRWSPDGNLIAFESTRDGDVDLFVMSSDGSGITNLTNATGTDTDLRWSPDGSRVVFASDRTGTSKIYVVDADGSDLTQLTTGVRIDRRPSWSPDGTKIVFTSFADAAMSSSDIFIMDNDGSNVSQVTTAGAEDYPTWSNDGTHILFVSYRVGDDFGRVYVIELAGSNERRLTATPFNDTAPSWKP